MGVIGCIFGGGDSFQQRCMNVEFVEIVRRKAQAVRDVDQFGGGDRFSPLAFKHDELV